MAVDHDFNLDLITLKEAAQLLRVSEVTIRRWLKQGRLRAYHVGPRAVRFRRDELHALLVPTQRARQPEHDYPSPITGDRGQVGPPTADEVRRTLAALATARKLGEEIRTRLGDQPFEESWQIIREAREDRGRRW